MREQRVEERRAGAKERNKKERYSFRHGPLGNWDSSDVDASRAKGASEQRAQKKKCRTRNAFQTFPVKVTDKWKKNNRGGDQQWCTT